MKQCPKCQIAVSDTAKFCVKCGFNIKKYEEDQAKESFCPECGTKFSGGTFCPECGYNAAADISGEAAITDPESTFAEGKGDSFGADWLSDIENDTTADVTAAVEDKLRAERAKPLAAFEFEEHTDGTYTITALKDKSAPTVTIPSCVVSIGDSAFENSGLLSVTLPDGIVKIGNCAFKGSADLMKINFPESLIAIGDEAFAGCEMLDVDLPKTVVKIGKDAMKDTAPDKRKQAALAKWNVGGNPTFGNYPQKSADVKEPIEWIVLERDGDKALLVSKYVLDARKYHSEDYVNVSFSGSSLGKWLGATFLNEAFDDGEKKKITNNGVFLLSKDAVKKHARLLNTSVPTALAKSRGAEANETGDTGYWLSSIYAYESAYTKKVNYCQDFAQNCGTSYASKDTAKGVRPAIWVTIE